MPEQFKLSPLSKNPCKTCSLNRGPGVLKQVPTEYYPIKSEDRLVNVLLIAEAPGSNENTSGRPVVGRTGKILRRVVRQLNGGTQRGVAYGNVVRCRPTQKNDIHRDRKPTPQEVNCCKKNILRDIAKLNPKYIVVCGDSAAKALLRYPDGKLVEPDKPIHLLRGGDFVVRLPDGKEIPAVVTWHFSYVFRTPSVTSVWKEDIAKAFRRASGALDDYSARGNPAKLITTIPELNKLLKKMATGLTKEDIVAFDYENESLNRLNNPILCVGFSWHRDKSYVVPFEHPDTPWSGKEMQRVRKLLHKFFSLRNPSFGAIVAHNLKFECLSTADQFNAYIRMPSEDTMMRAHALNEDRKGVVDYPYGLKTLVRDNLGFYHYDDDDILPILDARSRGALRDVALDKLAEYNGIDCYCTYRLYRYQEQWAKAENYGEYLQRLGRRFHGPVARVLADMERNGLRADRDQVRALMADDSPILARQAEIEREFYHLPAVVKANELLLKSSNVPTLGLFAENRKAIWKFHINKPDSKRTLYFDVLELDPVKVSKKTGVPSVDKSFFERYADVPEVKMYSEWSALDKLRGTYIKSIHTFLQNDPDMRDGRVRPHFKPTGTITGRISSANPNMLNIPSRSKTEASKAIKRLYICDPGYVMICADYSQAEVRWLAEITGDLKLIHAFQSAYEARNDYISNPTKENADKLEYEGDFHKHTASMIFGVSIRAVTKSQRSASKAIMFGLVYGMSVWGLASRLNISKNEAEDFIEKFFNRFPKAKEWLAAQEKEGFANGYVLSPTGRRKLMSAKIILGNDDVDMLPDTFGYLKSFKRHEDRVCRNAPIQGVASDTNLLACMSLLDYIIDNNKKWRILNTVYDSIMLEVPYPDSRECVEVAQGIMESSELFSAFGVRPKVPFAADFSIGINWGDQYDIIEHEEKWTVSCSACGTIRTEKNKPTNRRCEECGSRKVSRKIVQGTLSKLLNQLEKSHGLSDYWE